MVVENSPVKSPEVVVGDWSATITRSWWPKVWLTKFSTLETNTTKVGE